MQWFFKTARNESVCYYLTGSHFFVLLPKIVAQRKPFRIYQVAHRRLFGYRPAANESRQQSANPGELE
jgi:hypothetical protein